MRSLRYDEFLAMRRFPALDGLRALAAVMVFAFHFGGPSWRWLSGWIGVHLFFVLSGFLITTLLLREEDRYGRVSLRAFYLRRFFRIMPVYLVVLALTWALARLNGSAELVERSLAYYLLLLNELGSSGPFLHSWTIGIEQKFYLFWPAIAFVAVAAAFRRRLAVTIGLLVLLVALIPPDIGWLGWPVHYVAILLGCLTAVVMHHPRGYALVRPLTHPVTATAVIVGFAGLHVAAQFWPARLGEEALIGVYAAAAAILLLPALLSGSVLARGLGLRPLVFVGERSYSLYLIQVVAAHTVAGLVPSLGHPGTGYFLASVVVALFAADLLYRWVEQPLIEVGRRLAARVPRPGRRDDGGDAGPTSDPRPREVPAVGVTATRG